MAREISKCLPENKNIQKRNGYFVQGDDVVTWVVGHVLHQAEPGDYDAFHATITHAIVGMETTTSKFY